MTAIPGAPYFGAEIHNSTASTPAQIRKSFEHVREIGANLVFAPITWDTFERTEGVFDTTLVDQALATARELELKWVPLWFGAWKNGMSTYAPSWVKRDRTRFPRAELASGAIEHLSPFSPALTVADSAAFEELVAHLARSGASDVVPMIQVENEMGLLGGARDVSPTAMQHWHSGVPKAVVDAVSSAGHGRLHDAWCDAGSRVEGTWLEVFGSEADESFMAAAYATHTERVVRVGMGTFPRPYFVNAWLNAVGVASIVAGGVAPGQYPSGGPLPHLFPIWRALAPSISFFSPDIYLGDIDRISTAFSERKQPLVIPEMRRDAVGIGHMFRALGSHRASVVSPFGLDSLLRGTHLYDEFNDAYRLLNSIREDLASAPQESARGVFLSHDDPEQVFTFDDIELTLRLHDGQKILADGDTGHAIILRLAEEKFRVVGRGFTLSIASSSGPIGFDSVCEKDSNFVTTRVLGGDETGGGNTLRFFRVAEPESQGIVPFDPRFTGALDFSVYRY